MEWLSIEIADRLQFFTLPLEIAGLSLATIEVRFAALTRRLNARLVALATSIERSDARWRTRYPIIDRYTVWEPIHVPTPAWLQFSLLALLLVAAAGAALLLVLGFVPALAGQLEASEALLDAFFWWIYLPLGAGTFVLLLLIRFIVRFAEDRAVGTLGIVVAGLGVLGEAYQFAVALA